MRVENATVSRLIDRARVKNRKGETIRVQDPKVRACRQTNINEISLEFQIEITHTDWTSKSH